MLNRYSSLIVVVFLLGLAGCVHHKAASTATENKHTTTAKPTKQYRKVESFTQVDIQGAINVNLHTGYKKPQVLLTGDPRDLAQIKTVIKNSTLYLSIGSGFPKFGPVSADVRSRFLNSIRYVGAGHLKGMQLKSSMLDVYLANQGSTQLGGSIGIRNLEVVGNGVTQISGVSSRNLNIVFKGNPKVQLTGFASMQLLNMEGGGWLSFYWVKSDSLIVRAKKGATIQLAGIANRLDVELWDKAKFKGRYLRAQRTFVKTHGHAVAEISSVKHQSSLASDASDIYYFNIPGTRTDFMAFNGSVLDMREWSQNDREDFDRYNKQFP